MLGFLLRARGVACTCFSERSLNSEVQARLAEKPEAVLCLSALTPASARAAATFFKRLGAAATGGKILGFWRGEHPAEIEWARQPGVTVVSQLEEALRVITSHAAAVPGQRTVPAIAASPA